MTTWKPILWSLGGSAFLLAFAWGLRSAEGAGLVGDEFVRRAVQVVIGLGLAVYGNFMPKMICSMAPSLRAAKFQQSISRVGGWSMTLAGLVYAALWVFAPLQRANIASMAVVIGGLAIMLAYVAWAIAACRRARAS